MENKDSILKYILISAVGIIAFSIIIKTIRDKRKIRSSGRIVTDENVSLAARLNTAMYPERDWVLDFVMGADKHEIFRLAEEIEDFQDISKEYKNLYNESLAMDLQDALGSDYSEFLERLNIVSEGGSFISDEELEVLADKLYDEIDGINFFGRDKEPFVELLRLSDNSFKKAMIIYGAKYGDFKEDLEGEYNISAINIILVGYQDYSWDEIATKSIERYDSVMI